MAKYVKRPIDEFRVSSRDGSEFLIEGTALYPSAGGDDPISMELETSDGRSVRRVEKGVYQLADSAEIMRSHDPNAP